MMQNIKNKKPNDEEILLYQNEWLLAMRYITLFLDGTDRQPDKQT